MPIKNAIRTISNAPVLAITAAATLLLAGCETTSGPPAESAQVVVDPIPRTTNGTPDLSGIWQALGTANWSLLDHSPAPPALYETGAIGAFPGGVGVVEGNEIPYLPAAAEKQKQNYANRLEEDPEAKCYMPGVPRATYLPFPLQIVQTPTDIFIGYAFANSSRLINMGAPSEALIPTWMGTSNGRWDGDTLVVEVTGLNGLAWLDRSGNFASENVKVTERYSFIDPDHLRYEATIEDPTVYARPWTISMPLYRRIESNAQLTEFRCVEFAEEKLYGQFRKRPGG